MRQTEILRFFVFQKVNSSFHDKYDTYQTLSLIHIFKGLLAVVVPAFGLLRVGKRDAQFFQRLFLLGTQFPVAVLTVKRCV